MGIFSKRGWLDWRRMLEHNNRLDQQIEAAKTQREDLEKQIQALELSPFAQEQAVRQHLGYLRKDELIIEMP
jgi:cell division protein FtsB